MRPFPIPKGSFTLTAKLARTLPRYFHCRPYRYCSAAPCQPLGQGELGSKVSRWIGEKEGFITQEILDQGWAAAPADRIHCAAGHRRRLRCLGNLHGADTTRDLPRACQGLEEPSGPGGRAAESHHQMRLYEGDRMPSVRS